MCVVCTQIEMKSLLTYFSPPSCNRANVTSLIDIDLILSGGNVSQGIPSPLQPEAPVLLGADPTSESGFRLCCWYDAWNVTRMQE